MLFVVARRGAGEAEFARWLDAGKLSVVGQLGMVMVVGIAMIILGLIYLRRPTIFRRGIWLKTSIMVRALSEENYIRYMRGFGVLLIAAGVILAAFDAWK
jgi:hypothetical protein